MFSEHISVQTLHKSVRSSVKIDRANINKTKFTAVNLDLYVYIRLYNQFATGLYVCPH